MIAAAYEPRPQLHAARLAAFVGSVAVFYSIEWRFYDGHEYVYLRSKSPSRL
jgi:hypothetical protein